MKMNIFNIFEVCNKDFSKLQDKNNWFKDYLNKKIKFAFKKSYTTFAKNDLFDHISNNVFNKFVVQYVIKLFNNKVLHMLNTKKKAIQEFFKKYVLIIQYSFVKKNLDRSFCCY